MMLRITSTEIAIAVMKHSFIILKLDIKIMNQ